MSGLSDRGKTVSVEITMPFRAEALIDGTFVSTVDGATHRTAAELFAQIWDELEQNHAGALQRARWVTISVRGGVARGN